MTAPTTKDEKATSSDIKTDAPETDGDSLAKHVRFEAGVKSAAESKIQRRLKANQESATKVNMGKFNPFRDAAIVVGILVFMGFVGRDFDPSWMKKDPKDRSAVLLAFDKMKDDLVKRFEAKRRTEPCDLFADASSIPGAGLTIFAGRNYSTGDLVMETPMLWPVSLTDGDAVFLSSWAFLLNHRPNMTNVQGQLATANEDTDLSQFELRASATIREGDELFLPFDARLHGQSSLFEHIPTEEKYATVRDIIEGIRKSYFKAAARRAGKKASNPNFAVALVKKSVARVDPAIGTLLPKNNDEYVKMRRTYPLWAIWKGKGLPALQVNGKCLSHVVKNKATTASTTMVATTNFQEGDVVAPMPMYAMENAMTCLNMGEEECQLPSSSSLCFGHEDSRLVLCPLTSSAFITLSSKDPNVEYRWAAKPMRELSMDEVLSSKPGDLSWDVVALREIETGEEVRMIHDAAMSAMGSRFFVMTRCLICFHCLLYLAPCGTRLYYTPEYAGN